MRDADLTPTPGSRRNASINVSSECATERQLHSTGQARHPGGELAHFFLRRFFGLANRGVEGRGDQVFQHVLVVGQQAGVDGDAPDVVLASHHNLDQARA